MRRAELITYGMDDAAAEALQARVRDRGIAVRVTRDPQACQRLARDGSGVLLLRVGKNLDEEFTLLARAAQMFPHIASVVWGDADHPRLAALAWDLGARAVLLPPPDPDALHQVILRLLSE